MEILLLHQGIFMSQRKYAIEILKKFGMENCKTVSTPAVQGEKLSKSDEARKIDASLYRSLIGCLLYLSPARPDIMYATSILSKFMQSPCEVHYRAAKRVMRYVKGTADFGVLYARHVEVNLMGFTDSDWAGMICWSSKKQETVAQSKAEVEHIAGAHAINQAIWLRKLLVDLKHEQMYFNG
ncbi:secreted RxLR effector protein 161-like [Hevea brasiliensis]|uniref:secreted RxLR effector protein 161-like n=1 Tax=Hevea brasiliensis TaxID=3981 RepID=UPI0025E61E10|nr:secreted RxLR effector protein 161-like [Hevea brasiliensis]